jgi:hypothetical protein
MRYYLSSCEYKWTHADTKTEQLWIMRELGEEIYKTIESNDWEWKLLRSESQTLPGDLYCRCDIYVEIPDTKEGTHFVLKYPEATPIKKY